MHIDHSGGGRGRREGRERVRREWETGNQELIMPQRSV